jgi:hypothetical protein
MGMRLRLRPILLLFDRSNKQFSALDDHALRRDCQQDYAQMLECAKFSVVTERPIIGRAHEIKIEMKQATPRNHEWKGASTPISDRGGFPVRSPPARPGKLSVFSVESTKGWRDALGSTDAILRDLLM